MTDDKEVRDVELSLPSDVHERLESDGESAADTLAELAFEYALLQKSIDTYTEHGEQERDRSGLDVVFEIPPPIGVLIGFDAVEIESGRSVISFQPDSRHANPMGTLHGGVLCDVGDAAMGTAFASTLESDESFTTVELDIKFLKPVWNAELTAEAEVIKRGRRTGLVECTVTDEEGSLVAKLSSVCMVLREDAARNR